MHSNMRSDGPAWSLVQNHARMLPPYGRRKNGYSRSEFPFIPEETLSVGGKNAFEKRAALCTGLRSVGPFETGMRVLPAHMRDESPDKFYGELSGFAPLHGADTDELRFMGQVAVPLEEGHGGLEFFKTEYFPLEVLRPANSFRRDEYPQFHDQLFDMPLSERLPLCQTVQQVRHLRLGMQVLVCNWDGSHFGENVSGRVLAFVPNRSVNGYFDFSALIVHHKHMMLSYGIQYLRPAS